MSAQKTNKPAAQPGRQSGGIAAQQVSLKVQQGPLPSPEILKQYEEIHPGATDRIFKLTEKESEHRRQIEMQALKVNGQSLLFGQILSFILLTLVIGAGTFLIYSGKFLVVGGGMVATALIPFVVAFLRSLFKTESGEKPQP